MSSRSLADLHPKLTPIAMDFRDKAAAQGIDVIFTCTYRSNLEQTELYAQGRTKPGKVITQIIRNGKHNQVDAKLNPASEAFDIVPVINGHTVWDDPDGIWEKLGLIGQQLGLEWGGSWVHFTDKPHFQLPDSALIKP